MNNRSIEQRFLEINIKTLPKLAQSLENNNKSNIFLFNLDLIGFSKTLRKGFFVAHLLI